MHEKKRLWESLEFSERGAKERRGKASSWMQASLGSDGGQKGIAEGGGFCGFVFVGGGSKMMGRGGSNGLFNAAQSVSLIVFAVVRIFVCM